MKCYHYTWRTTYSTKPSEIFNENNEILGTINKYYPNVFCRIIDALCFEGKYFVEYRIHSSDKLIFKAKANLNPFKKRQYKIDYYGNNKHDELLLIDKKLFDVVEVTDFEFEGKTYHLKKAPLQWAMLTVNNQLIAEWHIPIKPPFKCRLKLHDLNYESKVLFLIGIFHTYLEGV